MMSPKMASFRKGFRSAGRILSMDCSPVVSMTILATWIADFLTSSLALEKAGLTKVITPSTVKP